MRRVGHPGSGAVAFIDWTRLVLTALPLWAALVGAERLLLRRVRREHLGSYPSVLTVLLVLGGVAIAGTGLVNDLGPSASRAVRPVVRDVVGLEWRAVTSVGDPVPGVPSRPTGDGIAFVASWRVPGEELQLDLGPAELATARAHPGAVLEVTEADGFLRVPYVAAVRFVAP